MRKLKPVLLVLSIVLLSLPKISHAAKFGNQFAEFELPPQWQCNLEGAEWVCQSTNEGRKRDAIIVLAAKIKGDQDSLDQYLAYLKAAKTYTSAQGKPVKSDPKYAKINNISGQPWVDSLHMESEIPGYYTRYLATVRQDIGVLVTYSINKDKYKQYTEEFENLVKTLKVFRKAGAGLNTLPQNSNIFTGTEVPKTLTETTVFQNMPIQGGADAPKAKPQEGDNSLFLILIGVGVVGFIIWKRRQGA